jgi:hypothetical protein
MGKNNSLRKDALAHNPPELHDFLYKVLGSAHRQQTISPFETKKLKLTNKHLKIDSTKDLETKPPRFSWLLRQAIKLSLIFKNKLKKQKRES